MKTAKRYEAILGFAETEVSPGTACQCPVVSRQEEGRAVRVRGEELQEARYLLRNGLLLTWEALWHSAASQPLGQDTLFFELLMPLGHS